MAQGAPYYSRQKFATFFPPWGSKMIQKPLFSHIVVLAIMINRQQVFRDAAIVCIMPTREDVGSAPPFASFLAKPSSRPTPTSQAPKPEPTTPRAVVYRPPSSSPKNPAALGATS